LVKTSLAIEGFPEWISTAENQEENRIHPNIKDFFFFQHFLWECQILLEVCQLNLTKQWMLAQVLKKHCAEEICTLCSDTSKHGVAKLSKC